MRYPKATVYVCVFVESFLRHSLASLQNIFAHLLSFTLFHLLTYLEYIHSFVGVLLIYFTSVTILIKMEQRRLNVVFILLPTLVLIMIGISALIRPTHSNSKAVKLK